MGFFNKTDDSGGPWRPLTDEGLALRLPIIGRRLVLRDFGLHPSDQERFRAMYEVPGLVFWATRPTADTPSDTVRTLTDAFWTQVRHLDQKPCSGDGWTRRRDYRLAVTFKLPELYESDVPEDELRRHASWFTFESRAPLPLVGYVSLNGLSSASVLLGCGEPDMGTTIHPAFQGRGLATEMLTLLAFSYLRLGFGPIYATRHPDNAGAAKSQARSGFIDTGATEVELKTGERDPRITSAMTLESLQKTDEFQRLRPYLLDTTRRPGGPQ